MLTWYLEMTDPGQLRPAKPPGVDARFRRAPADPEASRRFYEAIGRDWSWTDRQCWSADQWDAWVRRPGYEMWVAEVAGEPVGYLELDGGPRGDVHVAYLGILAGFTGMGLGGSLLSAGVQRAWQRGAERVQVQTCSLDGPHARENYLARGFRVRDVVVRARHGPSGAADPFTERAVPVMLPRVRQPRAADRRGPGTAGPGRATPESPRSPA